MKDERKTKSTAAVEQQLRAELMELRQKVAALEASTAEHEHAEVRARAEARSRAEERNRALYEFSPDGIVTVGLDGRITECNQAYAEMLGYSHKELEGFPFQDTMPHRWHDFCKQIHQEVMERGYSYEFEKECIKKDGAIFSASMRSWRIDDESGEPIGIWSIVRDITERKQKEEEFKRYSERLEELVEDKTRTLHESGESFKALAENANDGILISITAEGAHVYANKRAAEITGYSVDELLKTSIKDLAHPDEFKKVLSRYRKRLVGGDVPRQYETVFTRKDGKDVPIELTAAQTTWHGRPAVIIIIRDITERKWAEKALRESEREKAVILGNMHEHVIYQDLDMQILWANRAACESVGLSSEQLVGRHCYEIWNQRDEPCAGCPVVHARESGRSQETETTTPDGRAWLVRGYPVQDADGKVTGAVEVTLDITERKRAEKAMRESEEKFRTLAEQSPNMIFINRKGKVVYTNRRCEEVLGYNKEEFYAPDFTFLTLIAPEDQELIKTAFVSHMKGEEVEPYEYGLVTKDGRRIEAIFTSRLINYENESSILGIVTDITERKQAEEALRESEERYRAIFEQAADSIVLIDAQTGALVEFNDRAHENLGYTREECGKLKVSDFEIIESAEQVTNHLKKVIEEGADVFETKQRTKSGEVRDILVSARAISIRGKSFVQGIWRDITEQKRAEEALELKVAHLAALSQASRTVTASLELDQVLAEIVSLAGEVAASDYTTVILVDESGNLGRGAENLPGIPALQYRIRPKGLTDWIVRRREAAIIDEIREGAMTPKLGRGAPRMANPHIVEAGVKSVAGLPLIAKDRLLGVLYLHSLTPAAFHDRLPLLTAFASQAAIAIENARLYGAIQRELAERTQAEEELRQYARRLDTVHAIEEAILAAQSPEEIAQAVLSRIQQLVSCQRASVAVFDPEVHEATILAGTSASAKLEAGTLIPLAPVGDIIETLQRGETYLTNDLLTYPQPPPVVQTRQATGVRAFACVPLIVQGELIGALSLGADTTGRFGEEQVEIARELANQLAIALQQARLHEQIQRYAEELEQRVTARTRDLERRTVQLQVAAEVARDATTAPNLDELLDSAVDLIRERFGFYQAGIFLVDERGEYAVLRAATGEAGRQMLEAGHKLKVGEVGIVGHVTGSGQPRIALDVGTDAVHFENPFLPETRSELALPLKVSDRVIGALDVQSIHETAFDEDDVATLQIMADQLAVAIERTRLFEQTQATLEQRLRTVVANAPIVLFAMDREGMITLAEGKGLEGLGVKPGEHVGRSIFDVYRGAPQVLENVHRALAGESVAPVIKIGNALFESWYTPIRDESDEIIGVIGVATDVTERQWAEEALRESEEKYRLVSENIPVAVYSALPDEYSTNLFLSGRMEELTGYPPEQFLQDSQLWTTIVHPDDRGYVWEKIEEHRNNRGPLDVEYRIVTKDGTIKWVKDRATPMIDEKGEILRIDGFMEDITERKHLEEQMRLQERLAAVGQLAGGIAHDFNNFLTTIMLYAQILLRKPSLPPEMAPVVETILEESRRAAQLVRRLLDFSRRSLIETRPVDLASFVEETADILRRTLPENIQLLVDVGSEKYIVNADPARIQQVVMNLALNARDAMPDGGELHIGLSRTEVKEEDEPPVVEMTCGEWVCLTVSDTGTGMTEEVQSHLFEPFFTTKGPKGTGLGLAQVYGVVKRHDGYIGVETQAEQGTTFRVYLRSHKATELTESPKAPSAPPQGHGEIILLAEDEDRVREAGREILESLGYRVLIAANGQEAMQVYRSAERVDLVLTDLIMPEMGGKELAQALRKIAPRAKVLAITGYTLVEDVEELKRAGILDVVHKPFEVKTLAEVIRQTLDE